MKPGYYRDIPNDVYHRGEGVSKSQLDLINIAPALLPWSKSAPKDPNLKAAVDIGDALHALLLEPHRFSAEYMVAPHLDLRTNAGKEKLIAVKREARDRYVLTQEESTKLRFMRASVLAHPYARALLEMEGDVEPCIYAIDPETGELVRCRIDKLIGGRRFMLDIKTTANIEKFDWSMHEYRYDVQDAFYRFVYELHTGEPLENFLFLVVSTTHDAGRYPVRVWRPRAEMLAEAAVAFRENLNTYHECRKSGVWPGIEWIDRPAAITRKTRRNPFD